MEKVNSSEVLGNFLASSGKISLLFCHGKPCKQLVDELDINFNATLNNYSGLSKTQLTKTTTERQPQPYSTMHLHANPKNSFTYDSY